MAEWMVSLVNSHTNATSERWHLREIDLRFALNSTPGWRMAPTIRASKVPTQILYEMCFKLKDLWQ